MEPFKELNLQSGLGESNNIPVLKSLTDIIPVGCPQKVYVGRIDL